MQLTQTEIKEILSKTINSTKKQLYRPLEGDTTNTVFEIVQPDDKGKPARVYIVNILCERALQQNESLRYIRHYTRTLYRIQKLRIQSGNAKGALIRMGLSEQETVWMQENIDDSLLALENRIESRIKTYLSDLPIWSEYLEKINGVGPRLAASIISGYITPARFDTISKFWMYAGLGLRDGNIQARKTGEIANWSSELKTTMYKLEDQFIIAKGGYRDIYEKFRVQEDTANGYREKKLIKGHVYQRARRKTAKVFLANLWIRWREMEELPTRPLYVEEYMNHSSIIQPFTDKE